MNESQNESKEWENDPVANAYNMIQPSGIPTVPVCQGDGHEYRVIDQWFVEHSRTNRSYAAYCVRCLRVGKVDFDLLVEVKK